MRRLRKLLRELAQLAADYQVARRHRKQIELAARARWAADCEAFDAAMRRVSDHFDTLTVKD